MKVISSSPYNKQIAIVGLFGRNSLLVNGIQQTGPYTEKLWKMGLRPILEDSSFQPVNILVFGIGGGTVFNIFQKAFPKAQMVGVDIDPEIIRIGRTYFGLDKLPRLTLVAKDARDYYVNQKYDLVIIDLYIGNDVPRFVTQEPFLSNVRRLLRPEGRMIMNYFSEKNQDKESTTLLSRLLTIFSNAQRRPVLRNIFFSVVK